MNYRHSGVPPTKTTDNYNGNGNWCKVTIDSNPIIDALAIVGKNTTPVINPKVGPNPGLSIITYYRIISAGLNAFSNGIVNNPSSSAYNISPGIYTYDPENNLQNPVVAYDIGNFNRSYNIFAININTGLTTATTYDVWANKSNADSMTNYLNTLNSNYIVIISTLFDPSVSNYDYLPETFKLAMRRCGASQNFGIYNILPITNGSYVLVSIAGRGSNTGYEKYSTVGGNTAITDLRISVQNGSFTVLNQSTI